MRLGDEHPGTGEPSTTVGAQGPFTLLCDNDLATLARAVALGVAEALAAGAALPAADIGSRYQLGARLGGGGMAEVFSATMRGAEGFARRVAIKRVLPGLSQSSAFA